MRFIADCQQPSQTLRVIDAHFCMYNGQLLQIAHKILQNIGYLIIRDIG